ncbi:MAG: hypothetical protein U0X75_28195 [Acidobacteriota bacterium]
MQKNYESGNQPFLHAISFGRIRAAKKLMMRYSGRQEVRSKVVSQEDALRLFDRVLTDYLAGRCATSGSALKKGILAFAS